MLQRKKQNRTQCDYWSKLKGQTTTYHKNRSSHLVRTPFYFAPTNYWQEPLLALWMAQIPWWHLDRMIFRSHAAGILSLLPSRADASRKVTPSRGVPCVTFLLERRDLGAKLPSSVPAARWQRAQPVHSTKLRALPAGSPSRRPGLLCAPGRRGRHLPVDAEVTHQRERRPRGLQFPLAHGPHGGADQRRRHVHGAAPAASGWSVEPQLLSMDTAGTLTTQAPAQAPQAPPPPLPAPLHHWTVWVSDGPDRLAVTTDEAREVTCDLAGFAVTELPEVDWLLPHGEL